MSEKKTVPVELAHQLRRQDPHDTDEVIKLMNAASDCLLRLAAASSAESVAQGGETNAVPTPSIEDGLTAAGIAKKPAAPTRLVQVGDCTCSDHECGQCMRPVGPTLTVEQIENVRSWVRRGLTIGNIEAFDELCDFARIGLQYTHEQKAKVPK